MSIRESLMADLKTAMQAHDKETTGTLRLINAAIKDKDIAARTEDSREGISEDQVMALFQTMIKQRRESAKIYRDGGRPELAEKEEAEIVVIEKYLPKQLSEDEIKAAVKAAVAEVGAESVKDMGKVMGVLKAKYAGQMDFGKAGAIVKDSFK